MSMGHHLLGFQGNRRRVDRSFDYHHRNLWLHSIEMRTVKEDAPPGLEQDMGSMARMRRTHRGFREEAWALASVKARRLPLTWVVRKKKLRGVKAPCGSPLTRREEEEEGGGDLKRASDGGRREVGVLRVLEKRGKIKPPIRPFSIHIEFFVLPSA